MHVCVLCVYMCVSLIHVSCVLVCMCVGAFQVHMYMCFFVYMCPSKCNVHVRVYSTA